MQTSPVKGTYRCKSGCDHKPVSIFPPKCDNVVGVFLDILQLSIPLKRHIETT